MKKVSIVIPVYNAEKYLDECIQSVLSQTYPDIEIIVVNDGSTDKSLDILQKYSNILKIISKENGGIASARNAGIKIAGGEWIKPFDADDILYPKAVEDLVSATNELEDKTHTILYGNYDYIDYLGTIKDNEREPDYNNLDSFDFNTILLDHYIGMIDTLLIHRSTIEKFGQYNEIIDYPDYELILRYCLLHNCRLHLVQKTLAKYRIHKESQTWRDNKLADTTRTRKFVLDKLDYLQREKYEISLKHYKNNKPLIDKVEGFMGRKIFRFMPGKFPAHISVAYHYIKDRF